MSIIVYGASRRYPSEDIIKHAIGVEDDRGNPFQLITLDWNPKKKNAHQAKTKGFEDAIITFEENGISITYRLPGTAQWFINDFSRRLYAQIPYTKHNMSVLGSHYDEGLWTIREQRFRDAAQVIWERIKATMKREELEEHVKRMRGHFISMYESAEEAPNLKDHIEEHDNDPVMIMSQRKELITLQNELDAKQKELSDQMAWITAKTKELARSGIILGGHSEDSLSKLSIQQLRQTCASSGIKYKNTMKREEIINLILQKSYTPDVGTSAVDLTSDKTKEPETVVN